MVQAGSPKSTQDSSASEILLEGASNASQRIRDNSVAVQPSADRRFSEPSIKRNEVVHERRGGSVDLTNSLKRGLTFLSKSDAATLVSECTDRTDASSASGNGGPEEGDTESGSDDDSSAREDESEERGRSRAGRDGDENAQHPPVVTLTEPDAENRKTSAKTFALKAKPHLEQSASRERPITPTPTDIENLEEIRKAQRLGLAISTTDMPESHKVIRTIIRGDWGQFQAEANEECLRVRTYLLALNLKPEAAYATEWAIGTVLRDGDTLMAIFAVDKDTETGLPEEGLAVGQGGLAMRETKAEVDKMTAASQRSSRLFGMKHFIPSSRRSSIAAETRHAKRSKKQLERLHALERLSDMCIDLLRKTKLQVRVVIEVIHCKVARYMLTEAIDVLQPTLVIVGSRGRSLVKGTLAGSFSRYLIMKSSVPVMTARMKISSKKVKSQTPRIRLGNNLVPSRRFADVRIDELEERLMQTSTDDSLP